MHKWLYQTAQHATRTKARKMLPRCQNVIGVSPCVSRARRLGQCTSSRALSSPFTTYIDTKGKNWNDIEKLPEIQQLLRFKEELGTGNFQGVDTGHKPLLSTGMSKAQVLNVLDGGLLTFLLHVESDCVSMRYGFLHH